MAENTASPAPVTLEIRIAGRVQGVNFRASCKHMADSFGVRGTVKNCDDGSVEIVAQGTEDQTYQFLAWLQRGSLFSRVEAFQYKTVANAREYRDFSITRSGNLIMDQFQALNNLRKHVMPEAEDLSLPKHLVIIPDGNRRWAKAHGLQPWEGHAKAVENFIDLARKFKNLDIAYLTMWFFSTENWQRDKKEVDELMKLAGRMIDRLKKEFIQNKFRFKHLGRKDRLPADLLASLADLERATAHFEGKQVNFALDYGGRDEILRGIEKLHANGHEGTITEEQVSGALDTAGIPDPDLIIRTSGEQRISGILPWQSVYAELYFTPVHFPDFSEHELMAALRDYSRRQRRFGK